MNRSLGTIYYLMEEAKGELGRGQRRYDRLLIVRPRELLDQLGLTFPAIVYQAPKLVWRKIKSSL